jgi:uncharacterized heparinase superfamily protein
MDDDLVGLTTHEILRDLRFIKMNQDARKRVMLLFQHFKVRSLTNQEESELRKLHRRYSVAIRELKQMEEAARVGVARERVGASKMSDHLLDAKKLKIRKNHQDLLVLKKEIKSLEDQAKEFGF